LASTSPPANADTKAWRLASAGYATATLGLVAYLTINGVSGIPSAAGIGTAGLLVIGLLVAAAGMLRLRTTVNQNLRSARYGLVMQVLGLVGLLFGVAPLQASPSLSALYVVSAVFIVASGASALAGAFLIRSHHADIGPLNRRDAEFLILGTILIFSGMALILLSNVASYFFLSDVGNTVYTDVGATVAACGSVIAAYSFFVMHTRSQSASAPSSPANAVIPLPTTRHDHDLRRLASESARTTISWEDPP
jgi:hypothetical protein